MSQQAIATDLIGTKVGSYKLLRLIGEGGMGRVYEAVHEQIGRKAAIKVLLAEYANDAEMDMRFLNEARAVSVVGHPGLVSVYEVGRLDDGGAYLIMEYLDGESLRHRMKRLGGHLGIEALRIARQIAAALQAAHAKGIVHRDLKPENVMIVADTEVSGGERAKVVDFGIAKLSEAGPIKTKTGAFLGTARYMSPEQCRNRGDVGEKTDVYALGVMLYEMLTGGPPFVGALAEVVAQHLFEPAPSPPDLSAHVPAGTAALTLRMLAKEPGQRPSMRELVTELDRLAHQFATSALPAARAAVSTVTTTPQDQRTLGRRLRRFDRPLLFVVSSAAALAGVSLTAYLSFQRDRKSASRLPAESPKLVTSRRVSCVIQSTPPGAQVVRAADGQVLGQTPYKSEQDAAPGELVVILRYPGYKDVQVTIDRSTSGLHAETLSPVDSPEKRSRPSMASNKATTSAAKTKPPAPKLAPQPATVPSPLPPAQVEDAQAACDDNDIKKVYALYARLDVKQRAAVQFYCGKLGIGVWSHPARGPTKETASDQNADGSAFAQILKQAQDLLDSDPQRAKDLANQAMKTHGESGAGWLLYGMAACKMKNKNEAYSAYKHLDFSKRQKLVDSCAESGMPLL